MKYAGARGKAGANDASAELMGFVRDIFDEAGVSWQIGGMGRIDLGGNAQDMRASLERLASLCGDYEVYPGHMGSSTLDWERQNNPCMGGIL